MVTPGAFPYNAVAKLVGEDLKISFELTSVVAYPTFLCSFIVPKAVTGQFSSSGLSVSRESGSEIQIRNCIDDGSRSAVHAFQQECTNRLKVLCSKGKILNVQVKRFRETGSGTCNGVECK